MAADEIGFLGNLQRAIDEAEENPEVRVVILKSGLAVEADLIASLYNSQDALEGVSAFAEKREAVFKGG